MNERTPTAEVAAGPRRVPPGWRVRFAHHRITLDDGHRIGVSVGGRGVPLVFFHGIGMNRRAYLRLLNRLPQLGFLVVAIDAPGHGDSLAPPRGQDTFGRRVAITERVLDALGIERAVLVGHSMGGRTAAELAARRPERTLAVVLIDPALGDEFDEDRSRVRSPLKLGAGLAAGVADLARDRVGLKTFDYVYHVQNVGSVMMRTLLRPGDFMAAAKAIASADLSAIALRRIAHNRTPVAIVHGEKDMLVSLQSAAGAAHLSGAALVTLPRAFHSWVLTTPWTFSAIMAQLLAERRLGPDLYKALARCAATTPTPEKPGTLYRRGSPALSMAPPLSVIGAAEPRQQHRFHEFRIWE